MAEEILQIKINYESKDIRDLVNARSKYINIIIIVFIVIIFALNYKAFFYADLTRFLYLSIPIIGILIVLILSHYIVPKRVFKNSKPLQEELTISFTNESIKLERSSGFQELKWDYIHKIVEHKKLFVIYDSKYTAFPIPKRFFKNEKGIESIQNLLKDNLPKKKLKLLKK